MISAQALTMRYGPVVALDRADFNASKGEVVGLLGPNGAGKSTAMKILTTYLVPTSGTAVVGGFSVAERPLDVRRLTGYLPENLPLYPDMEVGEYLSFVASARGLSGEKRQSRIDWAIKRCGLKPMFRRPVRTLSKGYRQRTALAQAIVHDPAVVILDEPTSGLDPHQILEVRDLIRELAVDKTVVLSTHILSEAESMSDRIVIMSRGRVAGEGTLDALRAQAARGDAAARARVAFRAPAGEATKALTAFKGVAKVERDDDASGGDKGVATFRLSGAKLSDLLEAGNALSRTRDWPLVELTPCLPTLEETFLRLTAPDREVS